jgi:hypothetical protein
MKTGLLFVLMSAVVFAGCRSQSRVNQQLLERELRLQEDCIWRLKWAMEDQQRALDDARAQADTFKKEADTVRGKAASGPDLSPPSSILAPAESGRDSEAPRLPPAPGASPGDAPLVEPPPSGAPSLRAPGTSSEPSAPRRRNPPRSREAFEGPAITQASAVSELRSRTSDKENPPERLNPDLTIDRIVLNEAVSGGLNLDGKPGDELLGVVIEQRDAKDARMIAPGDVSIVVVDPAIEGKASKIARWDFDADEVAKHVRRNREGAALQFELPWPKMPEHSDLRLFVRFTTYDGRKLEANLPIEVQLTSGGGWKQKQEVSPATHEEIEPPAAPSEVDAPEPPKPEDAPPSEPPPAERRSKWSPNR